MKILVVEDEKNLGTTLVERLKQEGYSVSWAKSVEEAQLEIRSLKFDLAVLDVGLPDGTGFQVAALLKKVSPATAILFLTAFGSPEDRIRGLELGAEDYVVKPFHLRELLLRIQNSLKRAKYLVHEDEPSEGALIGCAKIFFSRFEAQTDKSTHTLTHKECALLKLLWERRGQVVSRDEILNHVWTEDEYPSSRTIDNFVMRLRRIVENNHETPEFIRSVRGVGYQLVTSSTEPHLPEET